MRIALVHYHLRPGGVSSVLLRQARLLVGFEDVLIISGEQGGGDIPLAWVEELGYDRFRPHAPGAEGGEALACALEAAMEQRWGGPADIVHVHNPLLKKNAALIPALRILEGRGLKLLLQNHDLAEDFRPDVYSPEEYPANCHYAVINSRDYSFLHRAGLKTEGLHLIPNEVSPLKAAAGLERNSYLYPVRAIRRKNIGEALLLSLFIPRGMKVAVTLPPTRDEPQYRRWKALAGELRLPVEFDTGLKHTLEETLGGAAAVITTSVKEGFGFSFLEPWTAGRAVMGRRIDHVCRDFEETGVRFDALYGKLCIPRARVPVSVLRHKLEQTLAWAHGAFGLDPPSQTSSKLEALLNADTVDFGILDEELQEGLIRDLAGGKMPGEELAEANPCLAELGRPRDEGLIAANGERIRAAYSGERIRTILRESYRAAAECPVDQRLSKAALLELYLDPLQLFLTGVGRD